MTKKRFIEALQKLNACDEAMDWVRKTPGTPAKLYGVCHRVEWLEFLVCGSKVAFDWAEYWRQRALIWAEFDQKVDRAVVEYDNAKVRLHKVYCLKNAVGDDAYQRELSELYREYNRKYRKLQARLVRANAALLRSQVSFKAIAKALSKI